jgi:RimJ/RimL family protein N-acetyltransferase
LARRAPAVSLVTADLALLDAAVGDHGALGALLGCAVADGWVVFGDALERARDAVAADPASARWGTRLFVVDDAPRTLIGWGGFKGPPAAGAVEIGYAIAPAWEGRGVATAVAGALVREAWADPGVTAVLAHTLPGDAGDAGGASVRVLERNGFVRDGENLDGDVGIVWRFRLSRPPRREVPG